MKTPQQWLAEQIGERPDDFALDELAAPLSWIANVQADARAELAKALESAADDLGSLSRIIGGEHGSHAWRCANLARDAHARARAALAPPPAPASDNPVAPAEGETPEGPQG